MAKVIMVQGTMSGVGKSLIVAGLCRVFKQDGYKVCPFKSQNMALNSFITEEGLEMGRAQVMQAEAAGIKPSCLMNPILLKPTTDVGSQVIVNGKVVGNMPAREYMSKKKQFIPDIMEAYNKLASEYDIIVIEGAGSPAEINLKNQDIVNMGMAALADAPVILVGDIDRGGVFAQLLGTLLLLEEDEKERVAGLVINKFRGDKTILDPGILQLEERSGKKVVGVVPYEMLSLDDEDSQTKRFSSRSSSLINIGVIKLPRISNISDFTVFDIIENVSVHYITNPHQLEAMDMIIIPGSKNTIADLKWMRETGIEAMIKKLSVDKLIIGICGGFQMLGDKLSDPNCVETNQGMDIVGMNLLPVNTVIEEIKTTKNVSGTINELSGKLSVLSKMKYQGYEIHHGVTTFADSMTDGVSIKECLGNCSGKVFIENGNVYGTYIHGIFDMGNIASSIVNMLAVEKGLSNDEFSMVDYNDVKEREYDRLADVIRANMNMEEIYRIMDI